MKLKMYLFPSVSVYMISNVFIGIIKIKINTICKINEYITLH